MKQDIHRAAALVLPSHAAQRGKRRQKTLRSRMRRWMPILTTWIARSRQRRALRELDDHLLRDIGITRAEAAREASKPWWCA